MDDAMATGALCGPDGCEDVGATVSTPAQAGVGARIDIVSDAATGMEITCHLYRFNKDLLKNKSSKTHPTKMESKPETQPQSKMQSKTESTGAP